MPSILKFKYISCILLIISPLLAASQIFPVDAATRKIYYAEEVLVKDGPQLELYHRAKAWFAVNGKPKAIIKVDNLPNGLLIMQNYLQVPVISSAKNQKYHLWYTLKIEMEDDRYWYSLTDFELEPITTSNALSAKQATKRQPVELVVLPQNGKPVINKPLQEATHQKILSLIQKIKKTMD